MIAKTTEFSALIRREYAEAYHELMSADVPLTTRIETLSAPEAGVWRCGYCNTWVENKLHECPHCLGSKR